MLLDFRLERLILERFGGINRLQELAIPKILSGKDVLIIAPTGYGKTEAALFPVFHSLLTEMDKNKAKGISVLYITPLRALNRDMLRRITWWCSKLGITYSVRHGDTSQAERHRQSKNPPLLLITTPETLTGILSAKRLGAHLENVKYVIIDEIHSLIDNNRGVQLGLTLARLRERAEFTTIGLSATVGSPKEVARYISEHCEIVSLDTKRELDITVERPSGKKLSIRERSKAREMGLTEDAYARLLRIKELVDQYKTLIFVNTRQVAEALGSRFQLLKYNIGLHHGSLSKELRKKTEDNFKSGKMRGLIATSSLELGLDIGDVDLVIQYMSPRQVHRLLQRVGRSGHREGEVAKGIVITSDYDDTIESLAIKRLAESGWEEPNRVERGSYDVIAHQLVGIVLDHYRIEVEQAHKILSKSYVYNITLQELRDIAEQLSRNRVIYYDKTTDILSGNINTRQFYYINLSTIPSTKKIKVVNVETNRTIAFLDEGFVMTLNEGDLFITRGLPWKVVGLDDTHVFVESAETFTLSIPDWEGEDIPVDYEIAQEVGRLRRELKTGQPGLLEKVEDKFIPDDEHVYIESFADLTIIHGCFGTLINNTLGQILGHEIAMKLGESTKVVTDPYRIIIQTSKPLNPSEVKRILLEIDDPEVVLRSAVDGSRLLLYKINHVGRMFGLVGEGERISRKLIPYLKNTPVYREALRQVLYRYYDVDGVRKVLNRLRNGELKVLTVKSKELSRWGQLGLNKVKGGELISPIEPTSEIVKEFGEHLLNKTVRLTCTYCNRHFYVKIGDLKRGEPIRCPYCGSSMIALTGEFRDGRLIEKDKRYLRDTPPLIQSMGRDALLALTTYGVGIETAKRILHRPYKDDNTLFLYLLEAQKQFIRTRGYWRL